MALDAEQNSQPRKLQPISPSPPKKRQRIAIDKINTLRSPRIRLHPTRLIDLENKILRLLQLILRPHLHTFIPLPPRPRIQITHKADPRTTHEPRKVNVTLRLPLKGLDVGSKPHPLDVVEHETNLFEVTDCQLGRETRLISVKSVRKRSRIPPRPRSSRRAPVGNERLVAGVGRYSAKLGAEAGSRTALWAQRGDDVGGEVVWVGGEQGGLDGEGQTARLEGGFDLGCGVDAVRGEGGAFVAVCANQDGDFDKFAAGELERAVVLD